MISERIIVEKRVLTSSERMLGKKSLLIKNIAPDATPGMLVDLMKKYGPVFRPRIIPCKSDSNRCVYGFVDLLDKQAEKALQFFSAYEVIYKNRPLKIELAYKNRSELSERIDDLIVLQKLQRIKAKDKQYPSKRCGK